MDRGFGGRLRAAMLAAGLETGAQLSERCGGKFSRQVATRWMRAAQPRISAEHLLIVADCLKVRMHWLMTGKGMARWDPDADWERALLVLDRLRPEERERWLACGEKMRA